MSLFAAGSRRTQEIAVALLPISAISALGAIAFAQMGGGSLSRIRSFATTAGRLLPMASLVDAGAEPWEISHAEDLFDTGKYQQAAEILTKYIQARGRNTDQGQAASYLLISAYRASGQLQDALKEADALLAELRTSASTSKDHVTRVEIQAVRDAIAAAMTNTNADGNAQDALDHKYGDLVAKADADADAGMFDNAIPILEQTVKEAGRNSRVGSYASYVLALAYQGQGRYQDALAECNALMDVITKDKSAFLRPGVTTDCKRLQSILSGQADQEKAYQAKIDAATDPLDKSLAQADLAVFRDQRAQATSFIASAVPVAVKQTSISKAVRRKLVGYFSQLRGEDALSSIRASLPKLIADLSYPLAGRALALELLHGTFKLTDIEPIVSDLLAKADTTGDLRDLAAKYMVEYNAQAKVLAAMEARRRQEDEALRQKLAAEKPETARWYLIKGTIDARQADRLATEADFQKGIDAEAVHPSLDVASAHELVEGYIAYLPSDRTPQQAKDDDAAWLKTAQNAVESPFRRWVALIVVGNRIPATDCNRLAKAVLSTPENGVHDHWLHELAANMFAETAGTELNTLAQPALKAEIKSDWPGALAAYQKLHAQIQKASEASDTLLLSQWFSGTDNSLALLKKIDAFHNSDKVGLPCRFLGVDTTIGDRWQDSIGEEAWVMLAAHGNDLAGGPQLLNGSFRYSIDVGNPRERARRWRDPVDYLLARSGDARPSDLRLFDPTSGAGEGVKSFVDDRGEVYPAGTGPDLYVGLTIPKGNHILSLPLHFSFPSRKDVTYGFYLFSSAQMGPAILTDPAARCIGAYTVHVSDKPGYVRAAVRGPLRCTLVIRRLNSGNANLPGIFLDPDRRFDDKGNLIDAQNDPLERSDLGFKAWCAAQRAPLNAGDVPAAYYKYLADRYPESILTNTNLTQSDVETMARWRDNLLSEAKKMRDAGRMRLAEIADDMAWNLGVRYLQITHGSECIDNPAVLNDQYRYLWNAGPQKYLVTRKALLYRGEDGSPKEPVVLAMDAQYAARMARRITSAALASDLSLATLRVDPLSIRPAAEDDTTPVAKTGFDDYGPVGARMWLDGLAVELGLSINGFNLPAGRGTQQCVAAVVYAAATAPLLRDAAPVPIPAIPAANLSGRVRGNVPLLWLDEVLDPTGLSAPARPAVQSASGAPILTSVEKRACLLNADQLLMLSYAYTNRDMFPTDYRSADLLRANLVLKQLTKLYPNYENMNRVAPMLAAFGPAK